MITISTILCPTDLSDAAAAAFRMACSLARSYGAKVVVLHAFPGPASGADAVDRARDDNFEKELLETVRANTPEHTGAAAEFQLFEGEPAEGILRAAANCDLIVMGTHGRTGFRRAVFGSVAEEVLRKAQCPVMTVRPETRLPDLPSPPTSGKQRDADNVDIGTGD